MQSPNHTFLPSKISENSRNGNHKEMKAGKRELCQEGVYFRFFQYLYFFCCTSLFFFEKIRTIFFCSLCLILPFFETIRKKWKKN